MLQIICLLHFSVIVLVNAAAIDAASSLRFVQVLWRHGDRTPAHRPFPTDVDNRADTWTDGIGQLTSIGIRQQHDLGVYLRKRYIDTGFLSPEYNASEIYIRSTDYNRTIRSASANLAGFYPESVDPANSIPIHVVSMSEDVVNVERTCPKARHLLWEEMQSDFMKEKEWENRHFMRFLSNMTGLRLRSFTQVSNVFDPLNCERIHQRKWPSWVTPAVFEKAKVLQDLSTTVGGDNPTIQRLKGGSLFGEIAQRSQAKANDTIQPRGLKYYAYSGHDLTIVALLKNFGAYDGHLPSYATALIFELHEMIPDQFTIKVFYINQTGSERPIPVTVKGCGGAECDLSTFVRLARNNTPDDWRAECRLDERF